MAAAISAGAVIGFSTATVLLGASGIMARFAHLIDRRHAQARLAQLTPTVRIVPSQPFDWSAHPYDWQVDEPSTSPVLGP